MPKKKHTTPWTEHQMNPCDVQERLNLYVEMVQGKMNAYWEQMKFTHSDPDNITVDYGNKYAKVVKNDGLNGAQSVHSFINMSNGDILKGNWKTPVRTKKGLAVRGNIFADDLGADRVNEHGPNYLRR